MRRYDDTLKDFNEKGNVMAKKNLEYLENWTTLNENIQDLTEDEVLELLETEKKDKKRFNFLIRLYGRYNTLRTIRERRELVAGAQ